MKLNRFRGRLGCLILHTLEFEIDIFLYYKMITRYKKRNITYFIFVCVPVVFIISVNQLKSATSVRPYKI